MENSRIKQTNNQQPADFVSSFFTRYKKWVYALLGMQLVPGLIVLFMFMGCGIYMFANNDSNWHPYKSYIKKGYSVGLEEGRRDKGGMRDNWDYERATSWSKYREENSLLEKQAVKETDDYIAQFPESERGGKRAQMKIDKVKLPIAQKLAKRYRNPLDFYAHEVGEKVKKENFKDIKEYEKTLHEEAWKVGYEYGYARGWGNRLLVSEDMRW